MIRFPDGATVPPVGQGTWRMGEGGERAAEVLALRAGLDAGMTLIDTAEMYGDGGAERVVGEAIAGRRDEVFLVSKVVPSNASRQGVQDACARSLRRLGTDRIDLYLLHWPGRVPVEETVAGFEALRRAGHIGRWGVSNFDVDGMAVAWSAANSARRRRHGASTAQVAIAWSLRDGGVVSIPKASGLAHVAENAAAARLRLAPEDLAGIDAAFAPPARKQRLEML